MRVVFCGLGGPLSCLTLDRLATEAEVIAVVTPPLPRSPLRRWRVWRSLAPLRRIAARHKIPIIALEDVDRSGADLVCVAAFPVRIRSNIPGINVHLSLLPRHRGADPLFWTYFDDDRETGVTVHWLADEIDAGDVVLQERVPLARGASSIDVYLALSATAAETMVKAVRAIENGTATRTPQTSWRADPHPRKLTWPIDYDTWDAERLWHFLRGRMHRPFTEIPDAGSKRHLIGNVIAFEHQVHDVTAGSVVRAAGRVRIYTRDGWVEAAPPPLAARLRSVWKAIVRSSTVKRLQ
jgi:methionyl-tRNA formyltransferase